ncbi:hypothetical protein GQ44DRAFT_733897 [Phaeosphaeriaceae sp. PMI808]|nr:hypothetical protein GQ44DRAFT_733897 [Phaeosphaeriaceae sp. PMI808]
MASSGTPELSALNDIADQLIASNPLDLSSWDVNLTPCLAIAKAHLKHWSLDVSYTAYPRASHSDVLQQQRRDERRAKGKANIFHSNKNDGNFLSRAYGNVSIMDSRHETRAIRQLRKEPHTLNRFNNTIANFCAELFLNRTASPFYHDEVNAYPFKVPNDKTVSDHVKDIWVYMRGSSGTVTASFSDDFRKQKIYNSVAVRINLFVQSGLADQTTAAIIFKQVYPKTLASFFAFSPNFKTGLGADIHGAQHPDDKIYVAAMACRGLFSAIFSWNQMNTFLVQGGWPWLRQYPRAYARLVFTVMMLLFAAVECYHITDINSVRTRLLSLAGKLVGNPNISQPNYWKVRKSPHLKGKKITIPSGNPATAQRKLVQEAGGQTVMAKNLSTVVTEVSWMNAIENPTLPEPLPSHIVRVGFCQHNGIAKAPFAGRVKVVHSVSELSGLTRDSRDLTVALAQGDQRAVQEFCAWAVQNSMMTVVKGNTQCLGCAVHLAQCVAALVVIA